jgi:nucleoside-diphosphate-sugar epimerase
MVELYKKMIAVSGLTGFVGSNLEKNFEGKFPIKPLSRESFSEISAEQLNGCHSVIHLAGKAHDLKNSSSPDEYNQVNFELTCQLYDAFLESDAEKFIFVSSVKAVADNLRGPLTESCDPEPKTHYGISKLKAEQYILSKFLPENKAYYILRPCMIHGPGNKGNLNLLYKFVAKGIPYPLADFKNRRSFLSVENFCFVIENIIRDGGIPSGIYNVADDEALSTNQLVRLIGEASKRKVRLWPIPPILILLLAKLGDTLRLPLNTERLNKLTSSYVVDNGKLKKALGKELPLSAQHGILKTISSFDNHF